MDNYIAAFGAALTAVFTGVSMWHTLKQDSVKIISMPNGDINVYNPKGHTVIIHKIIASKGTLWWGINNIKGIIQMGDSGETCKSLDVALASNEERRFQTGICLNGKRHFISGKSRRINFLDTYEINIILYPGKQIN